MITIYNKIDKCMENTSGAQVIANIDYLERPILLCLSPNNCYEKSVYGIMRAGAQAARLLTSKEMAARFKTNDFPVDILGIKFHNDQSNREKHEEIADELLFPYITKHGFGYEDMLRQARKVNIFAFHNGINTYKDAEDRLIYLLKKYVSYKQMEQIVSNIGLIALETNADTGNIYATSVTFNDVNDCKIKSNKQDSYQKLLANHEYDSLFAPLGETNGVLYIYEGSGIHSIKEFFKDTSLAKPALSSIVSYFLENSIDNATSSVVIPLNIDTIMKRLFIYANEKKTIPDLLDQLDRNLYYGGAPKYSEESALMRMELDSVYKLLRRTNGTFIRSLEDKKGIEYRLDSVVHKMKDYCSDVAFQQVLTSANMWKPKCSEDLFNKPTDKSIRLNYNAEK